MTTKETLKSALEQITHDLFQLKDNTTLSFNGPKTEESKLGTLPYGKILAKDICMPLLWEFFSIILTSMKALTENIHPAAEILTERNIIGYTAQISQSDCMVILEKYPEVKLYIDKSKGYDIDNPDMSTAVALCRALSDISCITLEKTSGPKPFWPLLLFMGYEERTKTLSICSPYLNNLVRSLLLPTD